MGDIKSALEIAMEKAEKLGKEVQLDENHAY